MKRYQVEKHPLAPARLPYAIKDNATGGYVTGGSHGFARVYSTKAEAEANIPRHDATNGWGQTYARTVHDRNLNSNALAAWRKAHPGQPDDPNLVAHINLYDQRIQHMNSVTPSGELRPNIAAAGGVAPRQPHGPITKATDQSGAWNQFIGTVRAWPAADRAVGYHDTTNPYTGKPLLGKATRYGQDVALLGHALLTGVKSVTDIPKNIDVLNARVQRAHNAYNQAYAAWKADPNNPQKQAAAHDTLRQLNATKLYAARQALPLATQTGLLPLDALPGTAAGATVAMGSGILSGPVSQGAGAAAGAQPGNRAAAFGSGFGANISAQQRANPFAIPSQVASAALPLLAGRASLPAPVDGTPFLPRDLMPPREKGTYAPNVSGDNVTPGASPEPEMYINKNLGIDMRNAPGKAVNKQGYPRNRMWYWEQMYAQHPEMFSPDNEASITGDPFKSPIVDDQWIKWNPSHEPFKDDILHHHHVDGGPMAVPLPKGVHFGWFPALHPHL